jgi:type IV secretory pathway TrbD component
VGRTGPGARAAHAIDGGRWRWMLPPLLRAIEYGAITTLGAVVGGGAAPAAFALLAAIAFHHYDTVYRRRQRRDGGRLGLLGGGWDGRILVAGVLAAAGAAVTGFWVLAGALAILFVGDAIHDWATFENHQRGAAALDDEQEEAE